jgi:hypothetical protein
MNEQQLIEKYESQLNEKGDIKRYLLFHWLSVKYRRSRQFQYLWIIE